MTTAESSYEKVRRKMVAARLAFMSELAKFSKDEIALRPSESEWSPLQLAHHLYIVDGLALEEMRRVQNEENPLIRNLSVEAPHLTRTSEPPVSLDSVLAGLAARREEIFEYLSSLPDEAWLRPLRSEEWGDLKFYQLVNILPQHDQLHTRQLAALKAEREASAQ
ncbi:MAG TPA: DinB family protein [Ktedonobacteraceae bacterium]|jgi:hypothetical protein|nr:DinB family protein [Ktedonobacteraceae bacterium]